MATSASQRLREEVELMERFTQTYRRKFAELIDRLNAPTTPSDLQCVRLCVEAVDMMLASQSQIAKSLREMTDGERVAAEAKAA
jgi:hypothetical protein